MLDYSRSPQAAREVRRDTPLRQARTCYGHLAGVAGVELMDVMLAGGWMEVVPGPPGSSRVHYAPTHRGAAALAELGVVMPASRVRKTVAFSCLDWTERRPHLGGALGRAIVDALVSAGCVKRVPESRVVELTSGWGALLHSLPPLL